MGFADSVFRLFRENSDVVPLARLKKRGVKNVTVLDWSRIQELIERAVDEALSKRRIDVDPGVLENVHRDAKEAFHRLLEQRDRAEETARTLEQEKAELLSNLEGLRGEIARSQGELATERSRAVTPDEIGVSGDSLDRAVAALAARVAQLAGDGKGDLATRVAAAAKEILDAERSRAAADAALAQRQRVEQLERRLAKLQRTLTETEGLVEQLRHAKEGDPGIESVFKDVQGIDPTDTRADQKRGLLAEVFRLNLELREVIAEGTKQPPGEA
jgi:hypothetical protein